MLDMMLESEAKRDHRGPLSILGCLHLGWPVDTLVRSKERNATVRFVLEVFYAGR